MGSVVVLTGSQQYWGERSLRDVIKLHANDKISVLKADESRFIRGGCRPTGEEFRMEFPLVVMLKTFFGCTVECGPLAYDEALVYERDQNYCQYWHYDEMGRKFKFKCTANDRTIDHILPRCRGGIDSYTNCVCACKKCNIKSKGNKTPKEAGLKLIRVPVVPHVRRGGWVSVPFEFDPSNTAHLAYKSYLESFAS
jgi:hypothetical protein